MSMKDHSIRGGLFVGWTDRLLFCPEVQISEIWISDTSNNKPINNNLNNNQSNNTVLSPFLRERIFSFGLIRLLLKFKYCSFLGIVSYTVVCYNQYVR